MEVYLLADAEAPFDRSTSVPATEMGSSNSSAIRRKTGLATRASATLRSPTAGRRKRPLSVPRERDSFRSSLGSRSLGHHTSSRSTVRFYWLCALFAI